MPTVAITVGAPLKGTVSTAISFTLTNPASNQFALTGFTLIAPAGWTVTACGAGAPWAPGGTLVGNSCQYGGGTGLNPGSTALTMSITVTAPAPAGSGTYPYSGTFTSTVQDGSSSAFYAGPSFALQVMSSTTAVSEVVTPAGGNTATSYSAGSAPYTVTASVTCTPGLGCPTSGVEAGLPVVWSATYVPATASFSFSPSSGTSDSTGSSSTTFQPSNNAPTPTTGDSGTVKATIGTSTVNSGASASIVTKAGPPTKVKFAAPFGATHYVTAFGTPSAPSSGNWATVAASTITASIADQFGNAEDLSTLCTGTCVAYSVTITAVASGGLFDAGAGSHPTSVTCGAATGLTCPTLAGSTVLTITFPYFQSGTYGSKGLLTAGATSTAPSFAAAGSSGNIVTSAFDGNAGDNLAPVNTPVVLASSISSSVPPCAAAGSSPCAVAGKNVNITLTLTNAQAGVPVTFYLSGASSAGYAGTFAANAKQWFTTSTNAAGFASALFAVDTSAGASAKWFANFTRPTDAIPTGTNTKSADTSPAGTGFVWTVAAAAATIKLKVFFTNNAGCPGSFTPLCNSVGSSAVGGLTLWIDGIFADQFGNTAKNPGPNAVQVTLTASAGVLSATTVYIPAGGSDTLSSFGAIAWTLPAGSGTSLTLTASGVVSGTAVSGTKSITTVSPNPTLLIKSPKATAGVVYSSSTGVVFTGNANVSSGYPTAAPGAVVISGSGITFSVDKGAAQSATVVTGAGTSKVTWSAGVFLTVGLHNITFTATDSKSNSVTSATWQILVDSSAPTIKFTTATGSTLTYGNPAKAVIFDTLGDLNTTSIKATYNGTAVAAANLAVTGTNTLGSNSTFQVSINNLPSGKWMLTLSAKDLAGNANAGVSITVTISVPFSQSVVINSATYTTIGSFPGISVSATNIWSSSQNLVVFAVWKNGAGQTVAVATGGLTLASGATGTAFAPLTSALPSGSYTVNVFVITTSNAPVSTLTSITVTV
ncbi:MAG TPA: hypothetical protein VGR53_08915 [Nitrososphaerales archaeon]|nr:hypothetical protein [Nitrososphaerales archaeon]